MRAVMVKMRKERRTTTSLTTPTPLSLEVSVYCVHSCVVLHVLGCTAPEEGGDQGEDEDEDDDYEDKVCLSIFGLL